MFAGLLIAAGVALVWALDVFDMFPRAWRSSVAARAVMPAR